MQLSDLVNRIRRGDKEAVKELVATYGSAVYQRAFERTNDRELAREAARQTFGQFVAIVQQQPEDDGWSLWFGDLIERNISTYTQISTDMRAIESELDNEIVGVPTLQEAPKPPRSAEPQISWEQEEPLAPEPPIRSEESKRSRKEKEDVSSRSVRDEIFDEAYQKKRKDKGRSGHAATVILLILVSLLLLWIVAGVAMTMQWLPYYDLGYRWFNTTVFKLF